MIIQIKDTLVSLDLIEQYFCCDLSKCKGECCIEGDAGAPVTAEEVLKIEEILPEIIDDLPIGSQREIKENGVAYVDEEGDLVTSLLEGGQCVFATFGREGMCQCAIEKACRQGRIGFLKPLSCFLYPVRIKNYPTFTAVNFHHWKICKCAETLGRSKGIRAYEFLKEPLVARFGREWYDELCEAANAYFQQKE